MLLDRLLLDTPVAALEATRFEIIRGTKILNIMTKDVMDMIYTNDIKKMGKIADNESIINEMQKELTKYIVQLTKIQLTESQSIMVPAMITSVNNLERSGDRVMEIASLFQKKIDGDLSFSEDAIKELKELEEVLINLFEYTTITLRERDDKIIEKIVELENKADELAETFQKNHITRLNQEICNVDSGVLFIDILGHLERIADHTYKIAMLSKDELIGEKRKNI